MCELNKQFNDRLVCAANAIIDNDPVRSLKQLVDFSRKTTLTESILKEANFKLVFTLMYEYYHLEMNAVAAFICALLIPRRFLNLEALNNKIREQTMLLMHEESIGSNVQPADTGGLREMHNIDELALHISSETSLTIKCDGDFIILNDSCRIPQQALNIFNNPYGQGGSRVEFRQVQKLTFTSDMCQTIFGFAFPSVETIILCGIPIVDWRLSYFQSVFRI
jgi:hypothetical protein